MIRLPALNTNQKLAAVAVLLGAIAVVGEPNMGDRVTLNTRELSGIVESKVDHVTALELADWIIQARADYRLIDLREPSDFQTYHIPTAESVSLTQLTDYPLRRNEKIVLYSDGGIHSAQAWMLLKARDYKAAYMLLGGLDSWKDEVLFPAARGDGSQEDTAAFERLVYVSKFFGGGPRSGDAATYEQREVVMPKVEMPTPPASAPKKTKKRREGC